MTYETQNFKIPNQSGDYSKCSHFVTTTIEAIIKEAIERGENKIFINTNLKFGVVGWDYLSPTGQSRMSSREE